MPVFRKILLVDDDMMIISIYERLLTITGFASEIVKKNNGEQAREYLIENKTALPEIIFVDLCMSVMSGTEFIKWFNEWKAEENIQVAVYVLSSSMSKYDYNQVAKYDVSGYIVKPLTAAHLHEIQDKHINKLPHFLKLS